MSAFDKAWILSPHVSPVPIAYLLDGLRQRGLPARFDYQSPDESSSPTWTTGSLYQDSSNASWIDVSRMTETAETMEELAEELGKIFSPQQRLALKKVRTNYGITVRGNANSDIQWFARNVIDLIAVREGGIIINENESRAYDWETFRAEHLNAGQRFAL